MLLFPTTVLNGSAAELQCNRLMDPPRCFRCPTGELGCACDGQSQCKAGLVCLGTTCDIDPTAALGEAGQPCREANDERNKCNSGLLYCDAQTNRCLACDPAAGKQAGCECSAADECQSGLTCDLPSATCVPCYTEFCANSCERMFNAVPTPAPAKVCPTFADCFTCRKNDDIGCKWCNKGGDRNCIAKERLCPSLYAQGNDLLQCGGELLAKTIPKREELKCTTLTCRGCLEKNDECKFCNQGGDWRCVPIAADCPSGKYEMPGDNFCAQPVCGNDCSGHGDCEFDAYVYDEVTGAKVEGRPVCSCQPGWTADEHYGCIQLTTLSNDAISTGGGASLGVFVGLFVVLLVFAVAVLFLAIYLRKRATRTVIVADISSNPNDPLEVRDDGTVETADGRVAFKCLFEGCEKAYFSEEDLQKHIDLRHGDNVSPDYNGQTFNNGATFAGGNTFAAPQTGFQTGFDPNASGMYDNSGGGGGYYQ